MSRVTEYEVRRKQVPDQEVISLRKRIPLSELGRLFSELRKNSRTWPSGPPQALYYDPGFNPSSVDVEVAFPVMERGEKTIPGGEVAYLTHVGEYATMGRAYEALFAWVRKEGLEVTGPRREIFLVGPGSGNSPAEYITEIMAPIARRQE